MNWTMWCCVVLVTVLATTTSAGGWPSRLYLSGKDCYPATVCTPFHYFVARTRRATVQATKDVECGKDKNGNITDCHSEVNEEPELETNSTTWSQNVTSGENLLPKSDECGQRSRKTYRVMFGEDAPLSAYPWIALLGYKDVANPTWLCGGTLINNRYVVSAGHCVHPTYTTRDEVGHLVTVRLGEHNLDTDPDCPESFLDSLSCASSSQDFFPQHVFIHEEYKTTHLANDISLIRLNRPVTFGLSIRPACLPPAGLDVKEFLGSRDAVVAGWGATEDAASSRILQRAPIPLASNEKCQKIYLRVMSEGQMCFGGRGKVDSCYGDSGGPIMQARKGTSRYIFLGIVSFGRLICGTPGTPAVYTNVSYYRDWIVKNLKP